ncbi:FAD/NAD(P)-binding protein [Pradoshia sp.]
MSLEALHKRVQLDLSYLAFGGPDWVRPANHSDGHLYDVIIVGGGQSGLGAAFALLRERVSNILIIDENPEGYEGPWDTYARMRTLRTPKHLNSIDLGVPSLTFRAWLEAQHGSESWDELDKIPRTEWMSYLRWFRSTLSLPVLNEVKLRLIEPEPELGLHRLSIEGNGAESNHLLARKVILATGIQGGGEWHIPQLITQNLPKDLYAHTSEMIDFGPLRGKKIAILGGGASAFDNANHALSEGVKEAHVFVRRDKLPTVNPIRQMEASGMIERYHAMGDADKYAVMNHFFLHNQPPTNDTFNRAAAWPGFELHLGSPWLAVKTAGQRAVITTPHGTHTYDYLIISTGLITDPSLRPELKLVESHIACWADQYEPPNEIRNLLIDRHPYLSPGFTFVSRNKEGAPLLHGLFPFNYSALISCGLSASALSGLRFSLPRLAASVADQLFQDDQPAILKSYYTFKEIEFTGNWTPEMGVRYAK